MKEMPLALQWREEGGNIRLSRLFMVWSSTAIAEAKKMEREREREQSVTISSK